MRRCSAEMPVRDSARLASSARPCPSRRCGPNRHGRRPSWHRRPLQDIAAHECVAVAIIGIRNARHVSGGFADPLLMALQMPSSGQRNSAAPRSRQCLGTSSVPSPELPSTTITSRSCSCCGHRMGSSARFTRKSLVARITRDGFMARWRSALAGHGSHARPSRIRRRLGRPSATAPRAEKSRTSPAAASGFERRNGWRFRTRHRLPGYRSRSGRTLLGADSRCRCCAAPVRQRPASAGRRRERGE